MPIPESHSTQPLEIDPIHEPYRVGKYYLCKLLGEGTYGKVLSAVTREGGLFAVKIVKRVQDGKNMETHIELEMTIMELMDHPFVARSYEFMHSSQHVYYVQEFYKNGDLSWLMELHHRISIKRARLYFQQLIVAVRYMHHRGIAHRDIKTGNVMIDNEGRMRLGDFGLSAFPENNGLFKKPCGTRAYMAPEILELGRDDEYDAYPVDVWACGCVLYYMVVGRNAYSGRSFAQLKRRIRTSQFRPMPLDVPNEVEDLLLGIFTPDPKKRMTITEIVVDPWFAVDFDYRLLSIGMDQPRVFLKKKKEK